MNWLPYQWIVVPNLLAIFPFPRKLIAEIGRTSGENAAMTAEYSAVDVERKVAELGVFL